MSQELHYTSVPRGLKPGSRGFCTVAHSAGLPHALIERLEGLSGYRPRFKPNDPNEALNPVAWSHLRLSGKGLSVSILSRVGPAGLDYTGRENKHAHHVVLDADERPAGGPAWLLGRPAFMQSSWPSAPQVMKAGRPVPEGDQPPAVCRAWAAQVGDAGWAGAVAEQFLSDPKRTVVLVYDPGVDVLALFAEALALLPPERRWEVTFSTYFTGLAPGVSCAWRGVLRDTPEERLARSNTDTLLIDLSQRPGAAKDGPLVIQARTGERVAAPPPPSPRPRSAEAPVRAPSRPESPAPARTAGLLPETNYPVQADDDSIPPPPPRQRRRRREVVPTSNTSHTVRLVLTVSAIALLVGLTLGGTGIAIYLRSLPPEADQLVRANDTVADIVDKPKADKSAAGGSPKDGAKGDQPPPNPEKKEQGGKPSPQDSKASPGAADVPAAKHSTGDKTDEHATGGDKGKVDPKTGKDAGKGPDEKPARPSEPEEKGIPKLAFFKIPPGDVDEAAGGMPPAINVARPVTNLELIGGRDQELKPYQFEATEYNTMKGRIQINESGQSHALVGKFLVKDSQIVFEWEPSTGDPNMDMRERLLDCVLKARFDEGPPSYYLLREPRMLSFPRPLKDLPKRLPQTRGNTWDLTFNWCVEAGLNTPTRAWTGRAFRFRELRLVPDGREAWDLKPDAGNSNKYAAEVEPPKAKFSVTLPSGRPGEVVFTFFPRPLGDDDFQNQEADIKSRTAEVRDELERLANSKGQANPMSPRFQQIVARENQLGQENDRLSQRRDELDRNDIWRKTVRSLLASRVEGLVTLKVGDREFELTRFGPNEGQDKGGDQ